MVERLDARTVLIFAAIAIVLWTIGAALMLLNIEVLDLVFIIPGSIAGAITWVSALLIAARRQQWGWVVGIALTNFLGGLVYAASLHNDTA